MCKGWLSCLLHLLSLLCIFPALASQEKELPAVKVNDAPVIDGLLDDPCWKVAAQATDFEDEFLGQLTSDQTVAFLAYDEKHIYVAFRCYDSQPSQIVARERKDKARPSGEDMVAFSIEPFHTHKFVDRSFFIVNPLGTKCAQIGGGRAQKAEWVGRWKAEALIVSNGWTAEIQIPFSILDYPSSQQTATLGINFDRRQQHTGVHSWWSNIGPQEFYERDGHWVGVLLPKKNKNLLLLPYILAGMESIADESVNARLGLDVKYPLTSFLTFVGTLSPDFSNVEQAVEGIDFSYSERFLPDRRPFFQEGASLYRASIRGSQRYLHTRRIEGVDLGLNLYGKLQNTISLGMLGVFNRRGDQSLVLRGVKELSPTSNVNLVWLNHYNEEDQLNSVLAVGERYRFKKFKNFRVMSTLAQSWMDSQRQGTTGTIFVDYASTRLQIVPLSFDFVAPDFFDEIGFFPFKDFWGFTSSVFLHNEWRTSVFRRGFILAQGRYRNHYNGNLFQRNYTIFASLETHSDYRLTLGWDGGRFEAHKDGVFEIGFRGRASDRYTNYGVKFSIGQRRSAPIRFINPSSSLRLGAFTAGVESQFLWHFGFGQQHILTVNYDFSPEMGVALRWVHRNEKNNFYFAFRRSGYAGVETFLIFGNPNAERFQGRFVVKAILPL
jgi:hypothetical protein